MTLPESDTPVRRIALAVGTGVMIAAVIGVVYWLAVLNTRGEKVNGIRIVAAAQAYSRQLRDARQPIPKSVALQELVTRGLLKPGDIAAFQGLDATLSLTADNPGPQTVLMRIRMPDGTALVLLADGSVQSALR
jgi:hypothetical protein